MLGLVHWLAENKSALGLPVPKQPATGQTKSVAVKFSHAEKGGMGGGGGGGLGLGVKRVGLGALSVLGSFQKEIQGEGKRAGGKKADYGEADEDEEDDEEEEEDDWRPPVRPLQQAAAPQPSG